MAVLTNGESYLGNNATVTLNNKTLLNITSIEPVNRSAAVVDASHLGAPSSGLKPKLVSDKIDHETFVINFYNLFVNTSASNPQNVWFPAIGDQIPIVVTSPDTNKSWSSVCAIVGTSSGSFEEDTPVQGSITITLLGGDIANAGITVVNTAPS